MQTSINQYNDKGYREGYWEDYYPNCNLLWFKGSYKDGNRDGYWEIYDINGKLSSKGFYKDGKNDGLWEWYHPNHNYKLTYFYANIN